MIRLAAILLFLPLIATAQPVAIRSGEHETFSRLVLSIGVGSEWTLEATDNGYNVQITGGAGGFDTTDVFERIPRNRIINAAQASAEVLSLNVECNCHADAFLWRPGQLVVDVIDGPDPNLPPLAAAPDVPAPIPSETASALPDFLNIDRQMPDAAPPFAPLENNEPIPESTDLAATEAALLEGLARAASQGILTPNAASAPEPQPADEIEMVDAAPESSSLAGPPADLNRPGIGISTSMDQGLASLGAALASSIDQQCLPDDLFQIGTWGDARAFHEQAAELAEALAGEFGEEPREAQETLARLYLRFGFGAEARAVLKADQASSQSRQVLTELAGIIDDYDGDYSLIAAQAGCATSAAVWAFLVDPRALEVTERNQITQKFYGLPQPLRGQIAPRLARHFVEIGDPDAAQSLLRAADSTDAAETHDVQAARALVSEEFDDLDGAITVLSQQAQDNVRTTPQSLIRLITLELEEGRMPSEADLLLAEAMRHEHRDQPIAQDLADIEARGRIANGQFQSALDLVTDRNDSSALDIVNHAFAVLADKGESGEFLGFAYSDIPFGLTPATENAVSRRLIDLGFPERAAVLLSGPAQHEAAAERRYLRAEAALGTSNFASALDEISGMTDSRAAALRVRAYAGLGEHRSALASLGQDRDANDATLQFRAGAWERLTVENDAVLSNFAQAVLEEPAVEPAETLADRRELLEQSIESRQAVQDLLLRFDGVTPTD